MVPHIFIHMLHFIVCNRARGVGSLPINDQRSLSIRIKRVLNIPFYLQFPTSEFFFFWFIHLTTIVAFKIRSLYKFYFVGRLSQTRAI